MREAAAGIRDTKEAGKRKKRYARAHGLPGRMIPVPREITAGCGLSWKAAPEEGKEILAALQTAGLAYEAEYRVLL